MEICNRLNINLLSIGNSCIYFDKQLVFDTFLRENFNEELRFEFGDKPTFIYKDIIEISHSKICFSENFLKIGLNIYKKCLIEKCNLVWDNSSKSAYAIIYTKNIEEPLNVMVTTKKLFLNWKDIIINLYNILLKYDIKVEIQDDEIRKILTLK